MKRELLFVGGLLVPLGAVGLSRHPKPELFYHPAEVR